MSRLTIHYSKHRRSANIFWILRSIYEECTRKGIAPTKFKEMQERVFAAGSYAEALSIIGEKVNLIEDECDSSSIKPVPEIVFYDGTSSPHDEKIIERIKELYPNGCRVALDRMDDVQAPPVGTQGTVLFVDDIGTIHVKWDTGGSLGIAYGEDRCHRI